MKRASILLFHQKLTQLLSFPVRVWEMIGEHLQEYELLLRCLSSQSPIHQPLNVLKKLFNRTFF